MKRKPLFGLALGGGGVRGYAHIGVLKVLEEESIEIDIISGCSMGGIIAALYSAGLDLHSIVRVGQRTSKFKDLIKLMDSHITKLDYIFGADNVQEFYRNVIPEGFKFEDLRIPLALSTVDIDRAEEVILQSGKLIPAINATMALPGIIEEVKIDGKTLIDGGSLNNVPADLVRTRGAEVVLAVDVSPRVDDSGFWKNRKIPGIAAGYWRANAIMASKITKTKLENARADIIIRPDIGNDTATLTGMDNIEKAINAGTSAARQIIPDLKKLLKERFFLRFPKIKEARSL